MIRTKHVAIAALGVPAGVLSIFGAAVIVNETAAARFAVPHSALVAAAPVAAYEVIVDERSEEANRAAARAALIDKLPKEELPPLREPAPAPEPTVPTYVPQAQMNPQPVTNDPNQSASGTPPAVLPDMADRATSSTQSN